MELKTAYIYRYVCIYIWVVYTCKFNAILYNIGNKCY